MAICQFNDIIFNMMNLKTLSILALSALSLSSCAKNEEKTPKYVFYLILDGCGVNTVLGEEMYQSELEGKIGRNVTLMSQFPITSVASTFSASNGVTDSAASGTALASGVKSYNGAMGVDPDTIPVYSIASWAKEAGKLVGVGSSVCINHATPAAQYAHRPSRNMYYEIGLDLAASGFDFFGGSDFNIPTGRKNDQKSLYEIVADSGYVIARGTEDYEAKKATTDKLIFFQNQAESDVDGFSLPYWIDHKPGQVSIQDILRAQIDFLYTKDVEKKGFFIMNEIGGKIDFACHPNDAATAFAEVATADSAVQVAYDFYLQHPDETLIVITADHETGGLTIGNNNGGYKLNLALLSNQKCSDGAFTKILQGLRTETHNKVSWEQVKSALTTYFGFFDSVEITQEEEEMLKNIYTRSFVGKMDNEKNLYYENEPMTGTAVRILNNKARIGWTSFSHTAGYVPVYAIGVGAENFSKQTDNAEIPLTIAKVAGYKINQRR